ncbi:MAG: hypothetical protein IH899_01915, partial [Planctomycetes bacterium]|nr:hypothetical protein [Planctomycetota bacterium]
IGALCSPTAGDGAAAEKQPVVETVELDLGAVDAEAAAALFDAKKCTNCHEIFPIFQFNVVRGTIGPRLEDFGNQETFPLAGVVDNLDVELNAANLIQYLQDAASIYSKSSHAHLEVDLAPAGPGTPPLTDEELKLLAAWLLSLKT